MPDLTPRTCTAFAGTRRIAHGPLIDVALAVKAAETDGEQGAILTFDDATGRVIDLDLRGNAADIPARLAGPADAPSPPDAPRGRGRPKLGVVPREVTLLPRQWEWLAAQSGGASQTLRRLVDAARRADAGQTEAKARARARLSLHVRHCGRSAGVRGGEPRFVRRRQGRLRRSDGGMATGCSRTRISAYRNHRCRARHDDADLSRAHAPGRTRTCDARRVGPDHHAQPASVADHRRLFSGARTGARPADQRRAGL
jgi:hypothetical protein